MDIEVTDTPQAEVLAALGAELTAFNAQDVGPSGRQAVAVFMREGETLLAGLNGYTAWGWLYVQWLWVAQSARGQGCAATLLERAEAEAKARGCHGAYIDTFNPVALKVYERQGYTVFGALPEFPQGRTRSFLQKAL